MANNPEISGVLYGSGVILGPDGRVTDEARNSILALPSGIERGIVLAPGLDSFSVCDVLDDAYLVEHLTVVEPEVELTLQELDYYTLYSRAMDALRAWPNRVLVVETEPDEESAQSKTDALTAARRLRSPIFVVSEGKSLTDFDPSLGIVGVAEPGDLSLVDSRISSNMPKLPLQLHK